MWGGSSSLPGRIAASIHPPRAPRANPERHECRRVSMGSPGSALARVFSQPTGDPYAGADLENAARLGALVWLMGAVLGVVLLPVSPPTTAIGSAGWVVAGVNLLIAFVGARRLVRVPPPSFDVLYALSFLGVVQIA